MLRAAGEQHTHRYSGYQAMSGGGGASCLQGAGPWQPGEQHRLPGLLLASRSLLNPKLHGALAEEAGRLFSRPSFLSALAGPGASRGGPRSVGKA